MLEFASDFDKRSARKMGGFGSGGWNSSGQSTVEECPKLAISALLKSGALRNGAARVWRWSRGDRPCASITIHAAHNAVRLKYSVGEQGEAPRSIDDPISIQWRACRFGGQRPLFRCPTCARSVLNLHLAGVRFACRSCARLTYASRREGSRDRSLRAANKLRRRLGGEAGAVNPIVARPKGMWTRTYDRLIADIERREGQAFEELASWMMKFGEARKQRAAEFWK
jgi:hypothetical protein